MFFVYVPITHFFDLISIRHEFFQRCLFFNNSVFKHYGRSPGINHSEDESAYEIYNNKVEGYLYNVLACHCFISFVLFPFGTKYLCFKASVDKRRKTVHKEYCKHNTLRITSLEPYKYREGTTAYTKDYLPFLDRRTCHIVCCHEECT